MKKTCSKCKKQLLLKNFTPRKDSKDGYRVICPQYNQIKSNH